MAVYPRFQDVGLDDFGYYRADDAVGHVVAGMPVKGEQLPVFRVGQSVCYWVTCTISRAFVCEVQPGRVLIFDLGCLVNGKADCILLVVVSKLVVRAEPDQVAVGIGKGIPAVLEGNYGGSSECGGVLIRQIGSRCGQGQQGFVFSGDPDDWKFRVDELPADVGAGEYISDTSIFAIISLNWDFNPSFG